MALPPASSWGMSLRLQRTLMPAERRRFFMDLQTHHYCVGRYHMMMHLGALAAQELEAHAKAPLPESGFSGAASAELGLALPDR